jgi:hypothetical protein
MSYTVILMSFQTIYSINYANTETYADTIDTDTFQYGHLSNTDTFLIWTPL